jgi:hypothetical protein
VRPWSWESELKAAVVGRGMFSLRLMRRGRSSSITSSSGGWTSGEKRGYVRPCKRRVWWRRCVDRAVCAVMSLSQS